jgi:hypothetical protein
MLYKIILIFTEIDSTVVILKMCTSPKGKQIVQYIKDTRQPLRGRDCRQNPLPIRHSPYAILLFHLKHKEYESKKIIKTVSFSTTLVYMIISTGSFSYPLG